MISIEEQEALFRLVSQRDGGHVELPLKLARLSNLVSSVVGSSQTDDNAVDEETEEVVVDLNTSTLQMVVEFVVNRVAHHDSLLDMDKLGSKRKLPAVSELQDMFEIIKPLQPGVTTIEAIAPAWCATFIGKEDHQLGELIKTADYLAMDSLLDLGLAALACRVRVGATFKMGSLADPVTILLLTKYLNLEDVHGMDGRMAECDVAEWRALLRSRGCCFEGGVGDVDEVSVDVLRWVTDRRIAVKQLRCSKRITADDLSAFATTGDGWVGCRALTVIGISDRPMSEPEVVALSRGCPALTHIIGSLATTDTGLEALAQGCSSLTSIDLDGCDGVTDAGLVALCKGCPALTAINLNGCRKITDAGLTALSQTSVHLTTINLSGCNITDAGVTALAQACSALTNVDLSGCRGVTDTGLAALSRGCSALTNMDLSGCRGVTDTGLAALSRGCSAISHLNLSWCRAVTDPTIHHVVVQIELQKCVNEVEMEITDAGLTALAAGCPALISINVTGRRITDAGLTALSHACSNLTAIDLSYCTAITDEGLRSLSQRCPKLENVDLTFCQQITGEGLHELFTRASALTTIKLKWFPDFSEVAVMGLQQRRLALTSVDLRSCQGNETAKIAFLKSCRELTSLTVTHASDEVLSHVCSGLTSLTVNSSEDISTSALVALVQRCPNLTTIDLFCMQDGVEDAVLEAIAGHCPGLTFIKLDCECTDRGLVALSQGCPALTSVNLRGSPITDVGLTALAQGCSGLQYLNLDECEDITDAGLIPLGQRCFDLTFIDLSDCKKLTDAGVEALAQSLPDLTIYRGGIDAMYEKCAEMLR